MFNLSVIRHKNSYDNGNYFDVRKISYISLYTYMKVLVGFSEIVKISSYPVVSGEFALCEKDMLSCTGMKIRLQII